MDESNMSLNVSGDSDYGGAPTTGMLPPTVSIPSPTAGLTSRQNSPAPEPRHSSRKRQPSLILRDMLNTSDTEESPKPVKKVKADPSKPYTGKRRGRPPKTDRDRIYAPQTPTHHQSNSAAATSTGPQKTKKDRSQLPHALVIYRTVEKETTDFYVCPQSRLSTSDINFLDEVHGEGANDESKLPILLNMLQKGEWERVGHLVFGDTNNAAVRIERPISSVYAVAFLTDQAPSGVQSTNGTPTPDNINNTNNHHVMLTPGSHASTPINSVKMDVNPQHTIGLPLSVADQLLHTHGIQQ